VPLGPTIDELIEKELKKKELKIFWDIQREHKEENVKESYKIDKESEMNHL
jgi:hypothetical protein